METMMGDLASMIDALMHEEHVSSLPEWTGMPLGQLVTSYWHPDDIDAAWRRWIEVNGHFDSIHRSRMWNRSHTVPHMEIGEHSIDLFHVDLRSKAGLHDADRATLGLGKICQCVGSTTSQMICAACSWHFIGEESAATEAWHDHAFPGWRDLPILPDKLRGQMGTRKMTPKLEEWFEAHYPTEFRVLGAPILTTRGKYGTRHVPNYSPFGGYDLSAGEQTD